jgi:hypothetical protein
MNRRTNAPFDWLIHMMQGILLISAGYLIVILLLTL